jgi:hypothetical protein
VTEEEEEEEEEELFTTCQQGGPEVFTNRGRWCCPEGRLTVHEEVGCVLVSISKDGCISL